MATSTAAGGRQYSHQGIVLPCELQAYGAWINIKLRMHPDQVIALKEVGPIPSKIPEHNIAALLDTGATQTVVPDEIAQDLGLLQTGTTKLTGIGGGRFCPVYLVEIQVGPWREKWRVVGLTSKDEKPPVPCIVGRDVRTRKLATI